MPIEQNKDFHGGQITLETWSPGVVAGNSTSDQQFTAGVAGSWLPTDVVMVLPPAGPAVGWQAGLALDGAFVVSADLISVRFVNCTAGALVPQAGSVYTVVVFRR